MYKRRLGLIHEPFLLRNLLLNRKKIYLFFKKIYIYQYRFFIVTLKTNFRKFLGKYKWMMFIASSVNQVNEFRISKDKKRQDSYSDLCVHIEVPVNGLSSVQEGISIIGDTAIHKAM